MTTVGGGPAVFADAGQIAGAIVERVGRNIVLALPLGLGKANHIANALYAKAAADRSIRLTIFTGLTLVAPHPKNELERRFLGPVAERTFGGYPPLAYAEAIPPARCRRTSLSTSSSSRPGSGSIHPMPSSTTSPPTTATRWPACSTAASTWWRNLSCRAATRSA
jgi:hypothetical protein